MRAKRLLGFNALLLTGLILGSFGVFISLLNQELSGLQQIAWRHALALGLILVLLWILKPVVNLKGIKKTTLLAYGTAFPISIVFFTYAIIETKIAVAVFALYCGSLLTAQQV